MRLQWTAWCRNEQKGTGNEIILPLELTAVVMKEGSVRTISKPDDCWNHNVPENSGMPFDLHTAVCEPEEGKIWSRRVRPELLLSEGHRQP